MLSALLLRYQLHALAFALTTTLRVISRLLNRTAPATLLTTTAHAASQSLNSQLRSPSSFALPNLSSRTAQSLTHPTALDPPKFGTVWDQTTRSLALSQWARWTVSVLLTPPTANAALPMLKLPLRFNEQSALQTRPPHNTVLAAILVTTWLSWTPPLTWLPRFYRQSRTASAHCLLTLRKSHSTSLRTLASALVQPNASAALHLLRFQLRFHLFNAKQLKLLRLDANARTESQTPLWTEWTTTVTVV